MAYNIYQPNPTFCYQWIIIFKNIDLHENLKKYIPDMVKKIEQKYEVEMFEKYVINSVPQSSDDCRRKPNCSPEIHLQIDQITDNNILYNIKFRVFVTYEATRNKGDRYYYAGKINIDVCK